MPYLSEDKIATLVERVVQQLRAGEKAVPLAPAAVNPPYGCDPTKTAGEKPLRGAGGVPGAAPTLWGGGDSPRDGARVGRGVYSDLDGAVKAARVAFERFTTMGLKKRFEVIAEMRREAHRHVETVSKMAVEETGLGRYDQKLIKNRLVIDKTPGPEFLEPWAQSGDDGLMIEEYAPYGVIGAITPTTNPTETVICNAIGMIAAGNSVVFNAHPKAKKVSAFMVEVLNDAVVRAGGPENLITCTAEPTIEIAQALMRHPGIRVMVVTGGPGVVKEAMASGKKCIAAGPGNPPVVVDETADLEQAAEGIVRGVGLDNNIVCTAEKEIIAVAAIADDLKKLMGRHGGYELSKDEAARVEKVVISGKGPNKDWVGKDAALILREAGITPPPGVTVAFAEVPEDHPFVQYELLLPVTGLVRVANATEAIRTAVRCEHGNGHTAAMYSKNIENLHMMAVAINTSIYTKNAPTFAGLGLGGEGFTSFTISSPTGEGLTTCRSFSRRRRCTIKEYFRIV